MQGRAFVDIARAAWNIASLDRLVACCGGDIVYPVAVGIVSAAHRIPLQLTIHAFLHAVTATGYRPLRAWFRWGRPTANACWRGSSRP